jgi:hypothetical protein
MNSPTRSNETTDTAQERFAAAYKANFGRSLTGSEAKAFLGELKDRCRASAAEVMAAIRVVADKRMDEPQRDPPTAPQLAREILQTRSRSGGIAGEETFDQAVDKIAAEPDASLRYSLFCNRGGSDALLAALARRGVELAIYGPGHPDWAWMQALMADAEWRNLARNMAKAVDDGTHNQESAGERLARLDSGSVAFHAALQRHIAKRAKEGWTQPPMDDMDPAIQAIMASMSKAAESFRARTERMNPKREE